MSRAIRIKFGNVTIAGNERFDGYIRGPLGEDVGEGGEMKYYYEIFDGDEWCFGEGGFDDSVKAKLAGVEAGFEYVRVRQEKP